MYVGLYSQQLIYNKLHCITLRMQVIQFINLRVMPNILNKKE